MPAENPYKVTILDRPAVAAAGLRSAALPLKEIAPYVRTLALRSAA